ncbi:MAG: succinate dehydrogenase cytochrome b subunit [Desulfobacterales bacterium]|nr:succinate dehydrogenase cytochrome b subunit [Desulfobacterales bacterium]
MSCFFSYIRTSIGKKLMMALTGISFCGFLLMHLAGNFTVFSGKEALVAYSEKLHTLGPILTLAEYGLLFLGLVHVLTGVVLFYENLTARPQKYAVKKSAGGRTIGSATMPYTGVLILIFVIIHLLNFHFVDRADRTIFQIVAATFSNPGYVVGYVAAIIVAAVHVSHGFWSAFQTIGASHPKYSPLIKGLGILFSLLVAIGFGALPIFIAMIS